MPEDNKTTPSAPTRQRNRFTVMEAVVRDFCSLSENDRDWVRKEIEAREKAEKAGTTKVPGDSQSEPQPGNQSESQD